VGFTISPTLWLITGGLFIASSSHESITPSHVPASLPPQPSVQADAPTTPPNASTSLPEKEKSADGVSDEYDECMKDKSTNFEWSQCGHDEIVRQEARLNIAWKKAFSCFSSIDGGSEEAESKHKLLEAQRLWIKWKDSACDFYETGFYGREGGVLSFPACKAAVISQRAKWLENFANEDAENQDEKCR
jgi:uncharacterized protein YecT (DUF1311 family)